MNDDEIYVGKESTKQNNESNGDNKTSENQTSPPMMTFHFA
jgi:hypothetical protein